MNTKAGDSNQPPLAQAVLEELGSLVRELRPDLAPGAVTLDSALERELGLDSLARMELLLRLERRLGYAPPEEAAIRAETARELLHVLQRGAAEPVAQAVETAPEPEAAGPFRGRPDRAATLVQVLEWHAQRHPDRPHIRFYGEPGEPLTHGELMAQAERLAAGLRRHGAVPAQPVAIMLPTGRAFFYAFFGVLLAGGVPVPLYPPLHRSQIEAHLRRQATILTNCRATLLVTTEEIMRLAPLLKSMLPDLRRVVDVETLVDGPEKAHLAPRDEDIAFLQYTSGSTGDPKGVVLSHRNLLANIRAMGRAVQAREDDVFVSWLPLYHDMGLIGAWLGSLYHGSLLVLMSPLAFIARPQRWLWAIHEHRATLSAAPNFAYDLCAHRLEDKDLEGLDLNSWRMAFNGAEPVSPDTLERFCRRFAAYGFRREAMSPVYGLAECSVGLAFPPPGRGPLVDRVRREPFLREGRAEPAQPDDAHVLHFVACGRPLPGHEIRVVDELGRELPERRQGRLQFRGPSVTSGYYRNPEATRALFRGDWLDSGDYAYMAGGEVYVTGRAKDLIIRAGRNIHPFELEQAVAEVPGVRRSGAAAFASPDPDTGTERLVVMVETRERNPERRRALRERIVAVTSDIVGIPPDEVVLAPPRTIPKTSSGKVRRAAARARYERGETTEHKALWRQLFSLALSGVAPSMRRARRLVTEHLFAGWAFLVFYSVAPAAWLAVALLPGLSLRRRMVAGACRLILRLARIPLRVEGLELLPEGPCVLAVNHASYTDSLVLAAVLPPRFAFVAKRELKDSPPARVFLERIGTAFVERFDPARGIEDTGRLRTALEAGTSLVFFPEGTFQRAPGLLPFRVGAFLAAAQTGVPLVPVALRGTRSLLRSGQWFPHRTAVHVVIGEPLHPRGQDWQAAVELRDAARAYILRHNGEPDLEPPAG